MSKQNIVMNGPFRHKSTLNRINIFFQNWLHPIHQNFGNDLINSVTKTNWPKVVSRGCISNLRN